MDAGAHEEARAVYGFALARAEEAGDWTLRAEVLSSRAKQAIWTGQPDEGLTLAELALVRSDRLTAAVWALLHTDRGRALAKMRRINETVAAIGTADEHFAHITPANEPPFMAGYNDARHAQLTGQPLADLAILGRDHSEATDRLTAAAAGHTDGSTRAFCLIKLASLTMATDDALRELSRHAAPPQKLDEAAHLRHRIATLLVDADIP